MHVLPQNRFQAKSKMSTLTILRTDATISKNQNIAHSGTCNPFSKLIAMPMQQIYPDIFYKLLQKQ